VVDTKSKLTPTGSPGAGNKSDGTNTGPLDTRAHAANRGNIEKKLEQGPGSINPADLAPPQSSDEKRFFAKRGLEVQLPPWLFLGIQHEGRSIAYNHSGTVDGHQLELSFWRLPPDVPFTKILDAYLGEEMDDLIRLGRVARHEIVKVSGVDGLLLVGAGPMSAEQLASIDPEELFVATDGTGRKTVSWRGPLKDQLLIVSMTSPIETGYEVMPLMEELLRRIRFSQD
jgi:hypothetical protein